MARNARRNYRSSTYKAKGGHLLRAESEDQANMTVRRQERERKALETFYQYMEKNRDGTYPFEVLLNFNLSRNDYTTTGSSTKGKHTRNEIVPRIDAVFDEIISITKPGLLNRYTKKVEKKFVDFTTKFINASLSWAIFTGMDIATCTKTIVHVAKQAVCYVTDIGKDSVTMKCYENAIQHVANTTLANSPAALLKNATAETPKAVNATVLQEASKFGTKFFARGACRQYIPHMAARAFTTFGFSFITALASSILYARFESRDKFNKMHDQFTKSVVNLMRHHESNPEFVQKYVALTGYTVRKVIEELSLKFEKELSKDGKFKADKEAIDKFLSRFAFAKTEFAKIPLTIMTGLADLAVELLKKGHSYDDIVKKISNKQGNACAEGLVDSMVERYYHAFEPILHMTEAYQTVETFATPDDIRYSGASAFGYKGEFIQKGRFVDIKPANLYESGSNTSGEENLERSQKKKRTKSKDHQTEPLLEMETESDEMQIPLGDFASKEVKETKKTKWIPNLAHRYITQLLPITFADESTYGFFSTEDLNALYQEGYYAPQKNIMWKIEDYIADKIQEKKHKYSVFKWLRNITFGAATTATMYFAWGNQGKDDYSMQTQFGLLIGASILGAAAIYIPYRSQKIEESLSPNIKRFTNDLQTFLENKIIIDNEDGKLEAAPTMQYIQLTALIFIERMMQRNRDKKINLRVEETCADYMFQLVIHMFAEFYRKDGTANFSMNSLAQAAYIADGLCETLEDKFHKGWYNVCVLQNPWKLELIKEIDQKTVNTIFTEAVQYSKNGVDGDRLTQLLKKGIEKMDTAVQKCGNAFVSYCLEAFLGYERANNLDYLPRKLIKKISEKLLAGLEEKFSNALTEEEGINRSEFTKWVVKVCSEARDPSGKQKKERLEEEKGPILETVIAM